MKLKAREGYAWSRKLNLSGDKSLSHRALIFAAMAHGTSELYGLSRGEDVQSTARCLSALGAFMTLGEEGQTRVEGWGIGGPQEPLGPLFCGNSGTTLRLLSGLVAAYPHFVILDGDASLRLRPQARVITPLRQMGCQIMARAGDRLAPLVLRGGKLKAYSGALAVASAQVKSCILLASVASGLGVQLIEKGLTRDHTEHMLRSLGVPVESEGREVRLKSAPFSWDGFSYHVPGDPSSAAFLAAAAVMGQGSSVRLEGVNLNPTRLGFYRILQRMGAAITITPHDTQMGEPVGTIEAVSSSLIATTVEDHEVPGTIDELPLLAVVATQAQGTTIVRGAGELRVKESDRISSLSAELLKLGVKIEEYPDGFAVEGGYPLSTGAVQCHGDHRLEMSLAVAALVAEGPVNLMDAGWASISFPEFWDLYPGVVEED